MEDARHTRRIFVEVATCDWRGHLYHAAAEQWRGAWKPWLYLALNAPSLGMLLYERFEYAPGFSCHNTRFVLIPQKHDR